MAYTKDQIANINQRATAVPRKKYVTDKGEVYIGQNTGRLTKRDGQVSVLQREVSTLNTTVVDNSASVAPSSVGHKYKISTTDNIVIGSSYEYYVHRNFEVLANSGVTINTGGQLCIGDGILRNNGIIVNNGEIILT
mgnify:CR=1 FL=1|tara:strand:+ start:1844 stop:2254 length:411 start_codon:yes stop_codon:yes gene_type:complete